MLLQVLQSSNSEVPAIDDVTTPSLVLSLATLTSSSVYWFRAYKSSDFSSVMTFTTDYFFLWSTDHDQAGSMDGGIWWGSGNNLDCSDFTFEGLIIDGYQAETPFPMIADSKFLLFYHTIATNPINVGTAQETNLMTATTGVLDTATYTQQTNPLGLGVGDAHTGYFRAWQMDNGTYKGTHFKVGSNLPVTLPTIQYSTLSSDGLTGTRGDTVNLLNTIPSGYYWSPSFGEFFKLYDKWWWLGTLNDDTTGGADALLAIFEANSDFTLNRLVSVLNGGTTGRTWAIYPDLDAKVAHCYQNNKLVGVYYTTFNLAQLQFQ